MNTDKKPKVGLLLLFLSPFIVGFLFLKLSSALFDDKRLELCTVESTPVAVENLTRDRLRRSMDKYYVYIDGDEKFRISYDSYSTVKVGDELIRNQYFYEDELMATALTSQDSAQLSFRPELRWYFWFPLS